MGLLFRLRSPRRGIVVNLHNFDIQLFIKLMIERAGSQIRLKEVNSLTLLSLA